MRALVWAGVLALALAGGWILWRPAGEHSGPADAAALQALLGGPTDGFARVEGAWPLRLPEDQAAHPDYRSEIWSVTGNLRGEDGRRFGVQLAFFRLALDPDPPRRESDWASAQVYRAHLAVTDAADERFHVSERFSRAALGLAGSGREPAGVWLEDWSLASEAGELRLQAAAQGLAVDLRLTAAKPPLGEADLARPEAGSATAAGFHFFLMPRLAAAGTLRLGGEPLAVEGTAWLDRAWGAVPLGQGQLALDRFALQLADGRDLTCLRLHRRGGGGRPIADCTLIGLGGEAVRLDRRDVSLESQGGPWRSPIDGTGWPLVWRLQVPAAGLDLTIEPLIPGQELDTGLRAWSGAVTVTGTADGAGHLELTGYGAPGRDD